MQGNLKCKIWEVKYVTFGTMALTFSHQSHSTQWIISIFKWLGMGMWYHMRNLFKSMATSGSSCDKGYFHEFSKINIVCSSLESIF
jgi:hypothetical protein